jgi:uncharacterized membrane protein YeaQ/YmgE (transglycosylase-associated protein family)
MGLLSWIIFGLIAGLISMAFQPGSDTRRWVGTVIVGIIGSVIGGLISTYIGWGTFDEFFFRSMMLAIVTGALFLWLWARFTMRRIHIK